MVLNVHRLLTHNDLLGSGGGGGGGGGVYAYRYTVTTKMIPALRLAAMRAILTFY